jgi:hypothetical protein
VYKIVGSPVFRVSGTGSSNQYAGNDRSMIVLLLKMRNARMVCGESDDEILWRRGKL